jgi:DMSO/TMAO reductase YedYZ molybdopterin-dependent catalytic subunit
MTTTTDAGRATLRREPAPVSVARAAAAGVAAAVAGMGAGHLVAAAVDPDASPVLAVGSTVIDLTPTPVKEWAVAHFGTNDKPVLLGSVLLVTLVLAAGAGLLAARRLGGGVAVLGGLVALAGAAALARPGSGAASILPTAATAAVGFTTLTWLLRRRTTESVGETPGPRRRTLLLIAGTGVAFAAVGQRVLDAAAAIGDVVLPRPADPAGAFPRGLEATYDGITPLRTPTADFYRVDTRLAVPTVDVDGWRLTVDGDVSREASWSFEDLTRMHLIERDITLTCVSNEVGGRYVGGARWLGVRLTDLLDRVGVGRRADQILSTDVDGFTISTPLAVATDGRDAMVAIGMNGGPLPREHGFPARLVTPGLYGFLGATKWLTRLTLTTYDDASAYWTDRGWATQAPIKVASRIDTPRALADLPAGRTVIGGVAWAQHRGIGRVEVRIDDGPWQPARLGADVSVDYWRQWYLPWDAEPGRHTLQVRATTQDGQVQTAHRMSPYPEGATGIQSVVVTVG